MRIPTLPLLLVLLLLPSLTNALTGKVISVADGDTITVLDSSNRQHKIRLYGIDCPESKQAFGNAAKKLTSSLTYKKTATVTEYDTDRYGRTVGVVQVNGVNVNEEIIRAGYAWQYQKYCKESFCGDWLNIEGQARNAKIGLWGDSDPVPPWDWRKGIQNSSYNVDTYGKYTATTGEYHGNVKSHVFHSSNCQHYNCKNCTQTFSTKSAAVSAGYRPCGGCKQ